MTEEEKGLTFNLDYNWQALTNNPKTTFIHAGFASICPSVCDSHVEHQLLKRPTIRLCNALACCRYVGFRIQQSTQPNMERLKSKISLTRSVRKELRSLTLMLHTLRAQYLQFLGSPL